MRTLDDFIELAENICKRRQIYVCGRSFYEVCAYLHGYAAAMDQDPFGVDHRTSFGTFVATRLGFPQKLDWPYVLRTASRDDDHAIQQLRDLLSEYAEALRNASVGELMAKANAELLERERNPPEQVVCWRKFSRALHRGDKATLQQLIIDHKDASVLWEVACPDDVAPLMDQIAESYAIPVLSESSDGTVSEIMSPDFGPIRLERIDDQWRIDAEPMINCRLAVANRTGA